MRKRKGMKKRVEGIEKYTGKYKKKEWKQNEEKWALATKHREEYEESIQDKKEKEQRRNRENRKTNDT